MRTPRRNRCAARCGPSSTSAGAQRTTQLEFSRPHGEASPVAKVVERNAGGGIHHVCYAVPGIIAARDTLISAGARVLGDGVPNIRAHGKPVLFFHPKNVYGE